MAEGGEAEGRVDTTSCDAEPPAGYAYQPQKAKHLLHPMPSLLLPLLGPLISTTWADSLAIVIGAQPLWSSTCAAPPDHQPFPPECKVEGRDLSHSDADAWRLSWVLEQAVSADHLLIFSSPDPEVRDWNIGANGSQTPFGSAISGPADMTTILDTLSSEFQPGAIDRVVLFFAAHGNAESGIHLEDRPYQPAEIRTRIETVLGATTQTEFMMLDACQSARMRSRGDGRQETGGVSDSVSEYVEVSADSNVQEMDSIHGGYLTLLVMSALLGGADKDANDVVTAGELSDFLVGRAATLPLDFRPRVSAPRADPNVHLPRLGGPSMLLLGPPTSDGTVRRWAVTVTPTDRPDDNPILLADESVDRYEAPVSISLPPGTYRVFWADYVQAYPLPIIANNGFGGTCVVLVDSGASQDASACATPPTPWLLASPRSADLPPTSSFESTGLTEYFLQTRPAPSDPMYSSGGPERRPAVLVGAGISSGFLERPDAMAAVHLGALLRHVDTRRRVHPDFRIKASSEVTAPTESTARQGGIALGAAVTILDHGRWQLSTLGRLAGEVNMVEAQRGSIQERAFAPAIGLDTGLIANFGKRRTRGWLEADWNPRAVFVPDTSMGGVKGLLDGRQAGLVLGVEYRL